MKPIADFAAGLVIILCVMTIVAFVFIGVFTVVAEPTAESRAFHARATIAAATAAVAGATAESELRALERAAATAAAAVKGGSE